MKIEHDIWSKQSMICNVKSGVKCEIEKLFWVRNEVKNKSLSGDACIVVLTQSTLTFHHTIEERNNTEKQKR